MSPEEFAHREWLCYVQPIGLVVSVPALLSAQCHINKNIGRDQQRLIDLLPINKDGSFKPELPDFPLFVREVLGWSNEDLVPFGEQYAELEVSLPQYRESESTIKRKHWHVCRGWEQLPGSLRCTGAAFRAAFRVSGWHNRRGQEWRFPNENKGNRHIKTVIVTN